MKKQVSTVIAALALALSVPSSAAAGTVQILTAHHAGASFSSTDSGITTEVFIDASFDALQTLPRTGATERASRLNLFIRQCAGACEKGRAAIMTGMGHLEPANIVIATNLDRARLQATVPLVDCEGTCPDSVTVDITWEATSPPISMSGSTHGPDEEGFIGADAVLHRDAVAFGTVSDGTTNFTPNASLGATLEWVRVHRIGGD